MIDPTFPLAMIDCENEKVEFWKREIDVAMQDLSLPYIKGKPSTDEGFNPTNGNFVWVCNMKSENGLDVYPVVLQNKCEDTKTKTNKTPHICLRICDCSYR
jgi:hypothetical protein